MLTWLCTFLPLSGCVESTEEISENNSVEPQFSIQDVRSPFLTPENCLSGSILQMVKTDTAERYFCANSEGILVGPSIEKQLQDPNGNFKYTWYTDGKLSHVPLIYTANGLLNFDTTEKLLLQSRQVNWFQEWIDWRPQFLEHPDATIFALQNQLIALETALQKPLEKQNCSTKIPQNMTCFESDVFMIEPKTEPKTSLPKQWQIHALQTFYADKQTVSRNYLENCSQQCNCSTNIENNSNHDDAGRVTWKVAHEICVDQGKRLPTYAELLQIHNTKPLQDEEFQQEEWLVSDLTSTKQSLEIYDWRDLIVNDFTKISYKPSSYHLLTQKQTIANYKPEEGKKAHFRCVSNHIQPQYFGSELVEIPQIPLPKMNTMRGYGEAWYRKDAGYRETVLNWEQFGKGYIEDRASVKDAYILPHAIDRLQKMFPQQIQIFQIAHSHFGYPIYAIRVSKKDLPQQQASNNQSSQQKPMGDILHVAAIHGNEIFTTNALLNGIEDLLSRTAYTPYLENYNFWFVPMVNPDGNWMAMRKAIAKSFGYKNGSNTEGSCERRAFEGTNLSENFPDLISPYPEKVQLEPETQGLLQLIDQLQLVGFISLHSGESNIFLPSSFTESNKNNARSGMSYFTNTLHQALEEDFSLPTKNLQDEEHEVSHIFARTGVPSLVIDYPTEIFFINWEDRSYVQKKYAKILDIYWKTFQAQQSIMGFVTSKNTTPLKRTTITIVELGETQPTTYTQRNGFFYMPLPNLDTITLRIESEGFVPVEKKFKIKPGIQYSYISVVPNQQTQ